MEIERKKDVQNADHPMQTTFRVVIEKGTLIAAPPIQRQPSYFEWSIVTDPMDIDGTKEYISNDDQNSGAGSMENILDDDENEPDRIENLTDNGRALEDEEIHHSTPLINSNPHQGVHLEGYEYTQFNPTNYHGNSSAHMRVSQNDAVKALEGLQRVLSPCRDTGRGYKNPELDLWRCSRIEGMCSMLHMFTNQQSHTYNQWVLRHAKQQ